MSTRCDTATLNSKTVEKLYGRGDVLEKILAGLVAAGKIPREDSARGKTPTRLHVDDLALVDEFHSRGRQATVDMCSLVNKIITPDVKVVDIGCGLGGTARYLATTYGCAVAGVDLTQEYVDTGRRLTEMVGLTAATTTTSARVDLVQGSALELPYHDNSFDLAWTEHVQMNIADKDKFYAEAARVLRPDGQFVFHDVLRGSTVEDPIYPCPWAESKETSALATVPQALQALQKAGLDVVEWHDQTDMTVAFHDKVLQRIKEKQGPPPLGVHLLMGHNAQEKLENHIKNLKEGRTAVVMGLAVKQEAT